MGKEESKEHSIGNYGRRCVCVCGGGGGRKRKREKERRTGERETFAVLDLRQIDAGTHLGMPQMGLCESWTAVAPRASEKPLTAFGAAGKQ
jgi:hypothetical protein